MSKERDLLKKILATGWLNNTISCEVDDLLTEPEPFSPDWVNYRQGVADATREPLSTKQAEDLWETTFKSAVPYYIFDEICTAIEQYHGIGVDDE